LVTGGASFIGSHLVDTLLRRGDKVKVVDDFSSGRLENLQYPLEKRGEDEWRYGDSLLVRKGDVKDPLTLRLVVPDSEVVYHLAAVHGGRGFIDTHPADCCLNMAIDQLVFDACRRYDVERICFASSACVYPDYLQEKAGSDYLLKEDDADPFQRGKANADLEYGWAKLMGEMALRAHHRQYGMKTAAVRIFTAYGPRENETHAIIALIARAFVRSDPYIVWGTGQQDRNFTYVQDIVDAMVLASEKIADGSAVNAGRSDRLTINQAADLAFELMHWRPKKIVYDLTKPQGVASRAADLTRSRSILGWEPTVSYREGFAKTIEWYVRTHVESIVSSKLDRLLTERTV
jgi:UDP-glucose 4-epimerase